MVCYGILKTLYSYHEGVGVGGSEIIYLLLLN